MNSLENLNSWSNNPIAYPGNAAYSITFSSASPTNQTTSFVEDNAFTAPPGINITAMDSTPRNIQYTIDLSSAAYQAYVDWGSLPYYLTSETAGTNIYRIVGPIDEDAWALIKSPTITIPDQAANFTYTSTITYPDPSNTANDLTKTWNTVATVTAVPNISTPTAYEYTKNSIGTIAGAPTILNTLAGTYGIVITPSQTSYVYTLSSSGSGGTVVFDSVLKTLTITGTKTQVNSHLASIQLATVTDENRSFVLSYQLTNPSSALNTVTQTLSSTDAFVINTATYLEDTPFSLGYVVKDNSLTATNFTISVAQTTPLPSVSPGYFTVNGSNVGNTWSTSNTKANINAANVIYTPPVDYTGTITMTVNQSKVDNGNTVIQITDQPVNIVNAGSNPEIVNMINRSYSSNTVTSIFSTQTPYISDGVDIGQTYTITLTSALGKFGNSAANAIASASYSFTGNLTATNAQFGLMKFVPNYGASGSGTFTYTQTRGSTLQVNQTLNLTGTTVPLTPSLYTFTGNSTWTPTLAEAYYGNATVLVVGGGGGGGSGNYLGSPGSSRPGGSGGGGGKVTTYNFGPGSLSFLTSYPVVVGAGGTAVTASSNVSVTGGSGGNSAFNTQYGAPGGAGGVGPVYPTQATGATSGNAKTGGSGATRTAVPAPSSAFSGPFHGGGGGDSSNGSAAVKTAYTMPTYPNTIGRGGNGGNGTASTISGTSTFYGGGGGGGFAPPQGTMSGVGLGGSGGGGTRYANTASSAGTNGRGGGGAGGGSEDSYPPGNGGSGIIIIKIS
jgi:hypothetical protein